MAPPSSPSEPAAPSARRAAPRLALLDAGRLRLDESGLRRLARRLSEASPAAYACRSDRYPYALLALADTPVGVDIERVEPWSAAAARSICTPAEPAESPVGEHQDAYFSSLWSSKEALAKALGDAVRYDPRRLEAPLAWAGGRAGSWRAERLSAPPGHVAWVCWRELGNSGQGGS